MFTVVVHATGAVHRNCDGVNAAGWPVVFNSVVMLDSASGGGEMHCVGREPVHPAVQAGSQGRHNRLVAEVQGTAKWPGRHSDPSHGANSVVEARASSTTAPAAMPSNTDEQSPENRLSCSAALSIAEVLVTNCSVTLTSAALYNEGSDTLVAVSVRGPLLLIATEVSTPKIVTDGDGAMATRHMSLPREPQHHDTVDGTTKVRPTTVGGCGRLVNMVMVGMGGCTGTAPVVHCATIAPEGDGVYDAVVTDA